MVWKESNGSIRRLDLVADTMPGMVGLAGGDVDVVQGDPGGVQLLDADVSGDITKADGEEWDFHLAVEDPFQTVPRSLKAEDVQGVAVVVKGGEKREALDVIPVGVREEKCQIQWPETKFLEQLETEEAQAGSGI